MNLGSHVGDTPAAVAENRQRLMDMAQLPAMPLWLDQIHGTDVLRLTRQPILTSPQADAVWSDITGSVCAVMTADCLPVLFCSYDGKEIAAAHAGWRGLCAGVLENTLANFSVPPSQIHVWLGPAIGPQCFEVGAEVKAAFVAHDRRAALAFSPAGDKYFADIWQLARQRLSAKGVESISGGNRCTVSETAQFFSWRRDGLTGRMATLVWLS